MILNVAALDHRFSIEVDDESAAEHLAFVLTDLRADGPGDSTYRLTHSDGWFDLSFDDEPVASRTTRGHAIAMLLWHINQETVRRTSPTAVLLHAAAAARDGVGIVLPAPMEHGKTTTVTGLLRKGYSYVTDEAVAVNTVDLRATAFPKSLSIDRGSWPVFPDLKPELVLTESQWQVPASTFATVSEEAVELRLIVSPHFRLGSTTRLLPVSRGRMLLTLSECCFEFRERAERNLGVLGRLVADADCYDLEIGDLDDAVRLIDGLRRKVAA